MLTYTEASSNFGGATHSASSSNTASQRFAERDGCVRVPDRDAPAVSAGHALELLDDRPLQILVAKTRKDSIGRSVPVQGTRIVREPFDRPKRVDSCGVRGH